MIRQLITISIIAAILVLQGCKVESLSPEELAGYVNNRENGLTQSRKIGPYILEAQYKPVDFISLLEKENDLTESYLNKRRKELKGLQYYKLRLASADPHQRVMDIGNYSEQDYYNKIYYFGLEMQQDIKLLESDDTLKCVLFHFERNYDLAPYVDFNLGFEKNTAPGDRELILMAHKIGLGTVKFRFKAAAIHNIPTIKLN